MNASGSIDDVQIAAGDWPDHINVGAGRLLGTEVRASDGTKILRITGNDEDDIVLTGVLRGTDEDGAYQTPLRKRDRLIAIRRAGQPVRCVMGGTSFLATLREFVPEAGFYDHVTYRAVLFLGVVGTPPLSATVSTQQQIAAHAQTINDHAANVGPATAGAASVVNGYVSPY